MTPFPYSHDEYKQKWNALQDHIKTKIPKSKILNKRTSLLMKILSYILFFIEFYKFSSTYYPNIYLSDDRWKDYNSKDPDIQSRIRLISTMSHEYVHLLDRKKLWLLFDFLYLSPQIFMLLFLLIFITGNYWWLLTLLFLSPIPSVGRAWIEFRGYRMSMSVKYWLTGKLDDSYVEWAITRFLDRSYYWMFPFHWCLQKLFDNHIKKLKENKSLPKEVLEIKEVLDI